MSKKIKSIAIVGSRGIPAKYGGFETFADYLARGLRDHGGQVTVTCEQSIDQSLITSDYEGIELLEIKPLPLGPLRTIACDVIGLIRGAERAEVVYLLGYGAAFAAWIPRLWGREVWINPDGLEWKRSKWGPFGRSWFRLMEFLTMLFATRVIADSDGIRSHLINSHGRGHKIQTIAYGAEPHTPADPSLLEPFNLEPKGYFLVVCRMVPENQILEFIEAHAALTKPIPLVIVGDIDTSSAYCTQLRKAAHPERVRFLGTIYDQDHLKLLRTHALAYLHGHSVGGTNPSLLEAMSAGAPIVAHDNPFNREVLRETEVMWMRDRDSAGDCLEQVTCLSAEDRLRIASHFTARVSGPYSWQNIVAAYTHLLRQ